MLPAAFGSRTVGTPCRGQGGWGCIMNGPHNQITGRAADLESRGQLPVVDPDYFIVERRPEKLHAYARGLLSHLRQIRAGGKARRYRITTIRSASVWLIRSYAAAGIAPALEAARLMGAIVQLRPEASTLPVRRSSIEAYWAAIKFDAGQPPDPTDKEPSVATLYAVAKHVRPLLQNQYASQKTAEATVRGWRRLPHYRDNVALQRPGALRT